MHFFIKSLDGDVDRGSTEVRGGAKLEELFNTTYWNTLGQIVPLSDVSLLNAWFQIRNAWVSAGRLITQKKPSPY